MALNFEQSDNKIVATSTARRPTPEQILSSVESQEEFQARGRLKVFLGYASGVGKSFRMIDEGRRRYERGQDVVIAATQSHLSRDVQTSIANLESIPLRDQGGVMVMDVPSILRRAPKVCLVDGLAYDNPPGSDHAKRWQDVEELLENGIAVITSVNLQHIEEKRVQVQAITGKHVSETIPLSFLNMADEIVVVDAPPDTCMRVTDENNPTSVHNLNEQQLSELREIALILAADVVDEQLERYLARHNIEQLWGTQERILVCLSPYVDVRRMIESAARNRDRFHGEMIVVNLNRPEWSTAERERIQHGIQLAEEYQAEVVVIDAEDLVDQLLRFARQRGITQIYVGQKARETWWERAFGNDLDRLIRAAEGIDLRVFPHT